MSSALLDGFGEPALEAEVDGEGLSESASEAAAIAKAALSQGWGNPVLTARVAYTGSGSMMGKPGILGAAQREVSLFADGGRATQASIFGEDGAEWAIPEEHSLRTAELLDAARAASGFTWGELIHRTGGLSASASHQPVQLTYAPVIHAEDAAGVERVLMRDKDRLMEVLRELNAGMALRDDVEVYA